MRVGRCVLRRDREGEGGVGEGIEHVDAQGVVRMGGMMWLLLLLILLLLLLHRTATTASKLVAKRLFPELTRVVKAQL